MNKQKFLPVILLGFVITLLGGCASGDGLESYNRSMYSINKTVDKYTLKPITKVYRAITPDPVEKGVGNFFNNIGEVGTFANSLLQGKIDNAILSSSRFVWNTTVGLGGIFDVATAMNIKANKEDFGQTLQTWGVPAGPYVVLPFFGPSTLTDSVGLVGDTFLSPINRYKWHSNRLRNSVIGLYYVDRRSRLFKAEKMLNSASVDEYSFVKNTYLQHRQALVKDGKVENKAMEDDLDDLYGE
ncbi:MAG: ABC transporter [Thiotrichales bacterium]|nr:MAG: ABC transporter [Thiotrichales bacterium]